MVSPKQIRQLATNPMTHMRFQSTGQLPRVVKPESPLIDLLAALDARDRGGLIGLTVDQDLGYVGSRQFHNGEQALRWVRPSSEMLEHESWPGESHRIKAFRGPIYLEQLLTKASSFPDGIKDRNRRLCDPSLRSRATPQADETPATPGATDSPERPRG